MTKKEINKKQVFYKANGLTRAKYSMTVIQNRIANQLLFETDLLREFKEFKLEGEDSSVYKLTVSFFDLRERFNQEISFNDVLNFLIELSNVNIFLYKGESNYEVAKLISKIHIDKEKFTFSIFMYSEIYHAVKDRSIGYTPIDIKILYSFKSFYSERLYELLRSWSGTKKEIEFKVDELKEIFLVSDRYERYNDFKRKCTNKAINEINKKGYMSIEMEEIKSGRKVETLKFIVEDHIPRPKKAVETSKSKSCETAEILENKGFKKADTNEMLKKIKSGKNLNFTNYEQREYDYVSFEKKLLGWNDEQ